MNARTFALVVSVLAAPLLASCRRAPPPPEPVIVGRLINRFGHPLVGATATIENSGYAASTNAQGEFSLAYAPGAFRLRLGARNCIRLDIPLTVSSAVRYALGTKTLLCVPELPPGQVVVEAHDRFYALPQVTLAVRQVTQPGQWGVQCTSTFIETERIPTLTGDSLTSWLPPQTVERLADHNLVLARANGALLDSEGITLGMGPACTGISNPTGERAREIYGGWNPHLAEHLAAGTYCFLRGARYQMPIGQASEGYCFRWVPNPSENLGPVPTEPPPLEPGSGQTEEGHAEENNNAEIIPPDCEERRDGTIPCSERCYRANRRWPNPDDPAAYLAHQRESGECYLPQ